MTQGEREHDREYEVVVQGATGFTGRLVAEFLLERYGDSLRFALAGRDRDKLLRLRDELTESSPHAASLPLLVADADAPASLDELARRTQVVCTTAGPYALYGSGLVGACARHGTHYCDLTGEVHWMQRMMEAHQDAAAASGARILHTCGFDSIPSDLGVYFLQREMHSRHGIASPHVSYRVRGFSGGASGGTVASMLNMMDEAERDPSVRRSVEDPYALNPKDQRSGPDGPDAGGPAWDADFEQWTAPFVMAAINTRVVRRSNALLDWEYGRDFRYDEAMLMGSGPLALARATGVAGGMGVAMAAASIGPLRRAFSGLLPQPGDGPSPEQREAGYFDIELLARHPSDRSLDLRARVKGDRDPGYGSTAKMLGETAVCLARDALSCGGGFWTPAAAAGDALLARLPENAGVSFALES